MIKGLVSVIVPVYNVGLYLRECLDSLLCQTYEKIEILLIDDGSRDGSALICDEYAQKDSRIKVIHKKNEGVSKTRNLGLDLSKGEFITFIDGDDTVEPCYIELMQRELVAGNFEIVRLSWERGGRNKTYQVSFDSNGKKIVNEGSFDDLQLCANIWGLFRSETLSNIRFDEKLRYAEDSLFIVETFVKSKRKTMLLINKPFYHYRIVANSASHVNPVECAKLSNEFTDRILKMKSLYPKFDVLARKYKGKDYLLLMYYLIDFGKKQEDEFNLEDVRNFIFSLRKEGLLCLSWKGKFKFCMYQHGWNKIFNFIRTKMKGVL